MSLSKASLAKLQGVHPDLVRVIRRAAASSKVPFAVIEGLRTLERQKQLKAAGATNILNSRHITGHAVDLVPLIDGKARLRSGRSDSTLRIDNGREQGQNRRQHRWLSRSGCPP